MSWYCRVDRSNTLSHPVACPCGLVKNTGVLVFLVILLDTVDKLQGDRGLQINMIIIPILSIFGFSFFFAKYFKTKLTFAIPITISILIPILYCFAMLKLLQAATYVCYFIGIFLAFMSSSRKQESGKKNIRL